MQDDLARDPLLAAGLLLQDPANGAAGGPAVALSRALRDLLAAAAAPDPLAALRRGAAEVAAALAGTDVVVFVREDDGVRLVAGTWAWRRGAAPRGGAERELARRASFSERPVHVPLDPARPGAGSAMGLPARWRGSIVGAVVASGPALDAGGLRVLLGFADAAAVLLGRAREEGAAAAERRRAAALEATVARALETAPAREPLARAGQIAAGAAHEMAGPLACLASNLRVVAEGLAALDGPGAPGTEARAELLAAARDAVHEAARLGDTLRAFRNVARPGGGPAVRFDPAGPIEDALRLFRAGRRECDVLALLEPGLPALEGAPGGLAHVVLNLLDNGADAMGGRGTLRVEARAADGALVVRVADAGCGIPEHARARVFEPWFTTKAPGRGTGLGLWLCRDIVESLGGAISFETGPGGTTFEVVLPGFGRPHPL